MGDPITYTEYEYLPDSHSPVPTINNHSDSTNDHIETSYHEDIKESY